MTFSHGNKESKSITNTLKLLMDDYSNIQYVFHTQAHSQYLFQVSRSSASKIMLPAIAVTKGKPKQTINQTKNNPNPNGFMSL